MICACKGFQRNGKPCAKYPWREDDSFCQWHDPKTYIARIDGAIEAIRAEISALEQKRNELLRKHERHVCARERELLRLQRTRARCEQRARRMDG